MLGDSRLGIGFHRAWGLVFRVAGLSFKVLGFMDKGFELLV